jgi:hypothetical protein
MSPVPAAQEFQRAIAIVEDFCAIFAALGIDHVNLPRGAFLKSPPPDAHESDDDHHKATGH